MPIIIKNVQSIEGAALTEDNKVLSRMAIIPAEMAYLGSKGCPEESS